MRYRESGDWVSPFVNIKNLWANGTDCLKVQIHLPIFFGVNVKRGICTYPVEGNSISHFASIPPITKIEILSVFSELKYEQSDVMVFWINFWIPGK